MAAHAPFDAFAPNDNKEEVLLLALSGKYGSCGTLDFFHAVKHEVDQTFGCVASTENGKLLPDEEKKRMWGKEC